MVTAADDRAGGASPRLCAGCGVCVGVCEAGARRMALTKAGEYRPAGDGCTHCGRCRRLCAVGRADAPSRQAWPLGGVRASFAGHSLVAEERRRGSSGGLTTRVLKALIDRRLVDGVIAVVRADQQDGLFRPAVLRTTEEIAGAAGSRYYPVEFSQVLREIRNTPGRYAIVGLPCVLSALSRAREEHAWLHDRLRHLLGLVCGHGVSAHYTTVLRWLAGALEAGEPQEVRYRAKQGARSAWGFRFEVISEAGPVGRPLLSTGPWVKRLWGEDLLTLEACFSCTDLFAEAADAAFMDAWLPQYASDPSGNSLVIVRDAALAELLTEEQAAGRVRLDPVALAEVEASQAGAVRIKRARRERMARPASGSREDLCTRHRRLRAHVIKHLVGRPGLEGRGARCALYGYLGLLVTRDAVIWPVARLRGLLRRLVRMTTSAAGAGSTRRFGGCERSRS